MKRKSTFIILVILILFLSINISGCLEQSTDSRTLGYMFDKYKNFSFQNGEEGDVIERTDEVSTSKYPEYIESRNITKVWISSYEERPLLFKGDLTQNYYIMPSDTIEYEVTIIERNNIEYIKEFWEASDI